MAEPKEPVQDDAVEQTKTVLGNVTLMGVNQDAAETNGGLAKSKAKTEEEAEREKDAAEEQNEDLPPRLRFIKPGDVVDVSDADQEELYWVGTSGQKVTVLTGIEHMTKLKLLCLRSNFIRSIPEVRQLTSLTSLGSYACHSL